MSLKRKILVVDDEPDYCALVKKGLEEAGFEVEVAYDGIECLQKVRSGPPDAIVLDIVMPEKDGHAVCHELKCHHGYRRIPVVVVTVHGSAVSSTRYSRYRSPESLADDLLSKPISDKDLVDCLNQLLRQK